MRQCFCHLIPWLIGLTLVACRQPAESIVPIAAPVNEFTHTPTYTEQSVGKNLTTHTPHPELSSPPTPFPVSTQAPDTTWPDYPDPVEESEIAIPEPVPPIEFGANTVNILLLGTDRRPTWKWYQTDAIVIASLDLESKQAVLISIPRDLYVYIPGWRVNRINTAEFRGGFEMIADTIRYNFGIPVHHWVRVEYWGFSEAIDLLGGIEIQPNRNLESMCEGISYKYEQGHEYHLDGFESMCYVRMRMNSSDFDRLRRQEEVIRALFDRVVSIDGFLKIPQLFETFTTYVDSDLKLGDVLTWIPLAMEFSSDPARIHFYRVDNTMVENWRTPQSNQAVLIPRRGPIQQMLEQAFPRR
jgi:LCP family protein required for cell wall assembly